MRRYLRIILAALMILWTPSVSWAGTNWMRGTFEARDTATGTAGTGPMLDGDNGRISGPNDADLFIRLDPDNDSVQQLIIESGDGTDRHTFTEVGGLTITGAFQSTTATFTAGTMALNAASATIDTYNAAAASTLNLLNSGIDGGPQQVNIITDGSLTVGDDLTVTDVANLNGAVNIGNAVGDALTIKPTTWTLSDTVGLDVFVTGADSTLTIINSGVSGGTRKCNVTIDGMLYIGSEITAAGTVPLFMGDTSHYVRWNSAGYFQFSHTLSTGAVTSTAITSTGNTALGDAAGDITTIKGFLGHSAPIALTISGDAVTVTATYVNLDGEGDAVDALKTINGGVDGYLLILKCSNAGTYAITVDETANIALGAATRILNASTDRLILQYDAGTTKWTEIGFYDND